jgi:hypothetical protein
MSENCVIDVNKDKKNFPERSLDRFFPNAARNLNSRAIRLSTGWAPDAKRARPVNGLRDIL